MSDKISVIIPVYNAEKFVYKTIESVLNSFYDNFELILVNDCSTDGTASVLDFYANSDERVHVYHLPENHHQAYARKYGFEHSEGDWIWFIDSDDTITEYAMNLFISRIKDYKSDKNIDVDIVIGQTYINAQGKYASHYPQEWLKHKIIGPKVERLYDTIPEKFTNHNQYNSYQWQNCLWKRTLLANPYIDWAENVYYNEDTVLMYQLYYYANNILYLPFITYVYNVINDEGCLVTFNSEEKKNKNTIYKYYAYMFVYFFLKNHNIKQDIFFNQETICNYFTTLYFLVKYKKITGKNEIQLFKQSIKLMLSLCKNFSFNDGNNTYNEDLQELYEKL